MTDKKSSEAIVIEIAGCKMHTLNAIAFAVVLDSSLTVVNPYPDIGLEFYNRALNPHFYAIEYKEGLLNIGKSSDNRESGVTLPVFDIDDPIGLLLALKFGDKISFAIEESEDFERKILILRRMGVKFTETVDNSKAYTVENFQPVKIKFNFQESNFYLSQYIARLTAICDHETEFLSGIDVISNLSQEIYPFSLDMENLSKDQDKTDELERRLQKLKKVRKEMKYHFKIRRAKDDFPDKIMLPADPVVSSVGSVLSLVTHDAGVRIGPLAKFENEKTFVSVLSKFGVKAGIQKIGSEYFYNIEPDKLLGRRIDENQMRAFPEAFGPLSILASFAEDKTIMRGLPTSSSLWKTRISGVAAILTSAGVRVGEVEDGFVIEPPNEFADIVYREFDDPYLQLVQLAAAIAINNRPLTSEFFSANKHYPQFQVCLDKIRPGAKSLAS